MGRCLLVSFFAVLSVSAHAVAQVTFLPPTPYLSAADSPFDMSGLGTTFFLEDFEDGSFDLPGTTSYSYEIRSPGPTTDSVDADDGSIDGNGNGGHSLHPLTIVSQPTGIPRWFNLLRIDFDSNVLGFSPNVFGFTWTDGPQHHPSSLLSFAHLIAECEDGSRESVDWIADWPDASFSGGTAEDQFIGMSSTKGFSTVWIQMSFFSETFIDQFEIDHIQFGYIVPEPATGFLAWSALFGLTLFRTKTRIATTRLVLIGPSILVAVLAVPLLASRTDAQVTFLPPTPYLSADDSPFDMSGLGTTFFLEDFEDGSFDLPPGVGTLTQYYVISPSSTTDSVDADDGNIDGFGTGGHSLRPVTATVQPTNPPRWQQVLSLSFDSDVLGYAPNAFGFVWTDGVSQSHPTRRNFLTFLVEHDDGTLDTSNWFADDFLDGSNMGETTEDRFIGARTTKRIAHVDIAMSHVSDTFIDQFEIDHIQFGLVVAEPSVPLPALTALGIVVFVPRRRL